MRRWRCDGDDDGDGGGGGCGGGEGDGDSDGAVAEGVAWMGRAGGGALELMAGRGYAIWGMQIFLLPPTVCIGGTNLHVHTLSLNLHTGLGTKRVLKTELGTQKKLHTEMT